MYMEHMRDRRPQPIPVRSAASFLFQFDTYRGNHTVDDASFNKDMDLWEHELVNQKKLVGHLQIQLDALNKVYAVVNCALKTKEVVEIWSADCGNGA